MSGSSVDFGISRFLLRPEPLRAVVGEGRRLTWLVVGDSVAAGSAHTAGGRSYAELLGERARVELGRAGDVVVNTAVPGWTVGDVLAAIPDVVARFAPDVAFVGVGFNDARLGGSDGAGEFGDRYRQLLRELSGGGAVAVVQVPNAALPTVTPPVYDVLPLYRDAALTAAADAGAPAIDHFGIWTEVGAHTVHGWIGQGCHPNAYGHRMLARAMFAALGWDDPRSPTMELTVPGAPVVERAGEWTRR